MRPNIIPFLGNHEYAALTCLPWLLEEITEENTEPDVLDILEDLTVYEETTAGGKDFVLVHAGLGGFSPDKALDDYGLDELILSRPEPGQEYFPDRYLIFGHTPTLYYTGEPDCKNARIFHDGRLVAIDCGCAHGGPLGCLCLDTLEEIYV